MKSNVLALSVLVLACGTPKKEDHDHTHEDENVLEEACEHLAEGPAQNIAAVTSGTGAAIDDDHHRYDIALADTAGGRGGMVRFAPSAAGEYGFFLSADVPLKVFDSAQTEVETETQALEEPPCSELKKTYVFPLQVGTYSLSFGPTTETSVSVVAEAIE